MYFSLRASILAGVVGEMCALILASKGETQNASFLATFSLMQFYEACAYSYNTTPPLSLQRSLALLRTRRPVVMLILLMNVIHFLSYTFTMYPSLGTYYLAKTVRACRRAYVWKWGRGLLQLRQS